MNRGCLHTVNLCLLALLLSCGAAFGQRTLGQLKPEEIPAQFRPPHPAAKASVRYFDIDPKRASSNMYSDDALPRSREFKRLDSTYYVGWMFEGVYKFEHAEDYLGYKNAIYPLEHALDLIEHDYAKALATRTSEVTTYIPIYKLKIDYTMIAYYLMSCYSNTDQPDKVYKLLRRDIKWNFQRQYYMDAYNYLAWTVHRSRFYKHDKYSFLKNSIEENEQLASRYLDTSMMIIARNKVLHDKLEPGMVEREKESVYHYREILYCYAFQMDSAQHYFDLMKEAGRLPHNNYATFKAVCGDFRTAESEYKIAAEQDGTDKRLQEWAYYTTILDIYKANPKMGVELARSMIKSAGTTPGYGWYNIALARCLLYDGQVVEAQKYEDRAADFKELHIGTTLGQSHYEFSVQLLKLINKENEWAMQQFEHSNWWYNPSVLLSMSGKLSEKYLQQFLIINQFAQNPERDRVIYKLFANESTVAWDEIWYLVKDFSTGFFVDRFKKEAVEDKRPHIKKYFELFTAMLKMKQGKYKEAKAMLDVLAAGTDIDPTYEKLFTARLCQAEAECCKELKNENGKNDWLYKLYVNYPQLVPFCSMKMNMALHVSGEENAAVIDRLKSCNINWVNNSSIPAPAAYVQFSRKGTLKNITYYVLDKNGNYLVPKQTFSWLKADEAGVQLAYKLFNIGGTDPVEKPVAGH